MKITYHLDFETIVRGRSSPFAFGLVLDTSTSMQGKPLEHAKEAARMVITHLSAEDRISVVTSSDTARTVVPLQFPTDKPRLQALIACIEIEGSTNLTAGWMLGRDEVAKAPEEWPRKVLLLTDGQTNIGITEPAQIRQIIGQGWEQAHVRTSCLGFGDGYNEDLLNNLAKPEAPCTMRTRRRSSRPSFSRNSIPCSGSAPKTFGCVCKSSTTAPVCRS
jgi:Ca-activated chloride channel homolog